MVTLKSFRKWVADKINPPPVQTTRDFGEPVKLAQANSDPVQLRRWESAETTRLNSAQWCGIQATPINSDIQEQLETLIARCRHERNNNAMVKGVISSFTKFVVGKGGPTLIVESEDENYNATVKQVWSEYFKSASVDGMHGTDLLKRLIGQEFDCGNWLQQKVNFTRELPSSAPVKTRLLDIDPIRLGTPLASISRPNIIFGVERNKWGVPTQYHVRNPTDQNLNPAHDWSLNYKSIAAEDVLHCFKSQEPGQALGFPRLASVLQDQADLRDYESQVLDAVRAQANNGMLLYTLQSEFIGVDPKAFTGSIALERQTAKAIPPGYQVAGQSQTQPGSEYIPFRHEKLRNLGRIVDMPLLMVLLSAEESNFSQSRIDLNVLFQNTVTDEQEWIERQWLNQQLAFVLRESNLAFSPGKTSRDQNPFLLARRPDKVEYKWGWEQIAQASELDHLKTIEGKIKLGMAAPGMELAKEGIPEDIILNSIAATNKKREERGLDPLPGPDQPNPMPAEEATNATQAKQKQTPGNGSTKKPAEGKNGRSTRQSPVHA